MKALSDDEGRGPEFQTCDRSLDLELPHQVRRPTRLEECELNTLAAHWHI